MNTYSFTFKNTAIGVDVHPAQGEAKAAILYFHGGGLLYGRRDDLPLPYIKAITSRGYHLLCMDYLLAPESPLSDIHASVERGVEWFLSAREELGLGNCPFVLFGRSAGAYLVLTQAYRMAQRGGKQPLALLPFYGYHTLNHPFFLHPSSHYCLLPLIEESLLPDLRGAAAVSSGAMESRFFLYVYARQHGKWLEMLSASSEDMAAFAVPEEALSHLPPAFLTASTSDADVPFSFSKKLSVRIPNSQFLQVFNLEHDYDRDPQLPESRELYQACLDWLDRRICET